jgi:hypothetical protein
MKSSERPMLFAAGSERKQNKNLSRLLVDLVLGEPNNEAARYDLSEM